MSTESQQDRILIGILSDRTDTEAALSRINKAIHSLNDDFFQGSRKAIYQLVTRYFNKSGGRISLSLFSEVLEFRGLDEETALEYRLLFSKYVESDPIEEHVFIFSCEALKEQIRFEKYASVLADTGEILTKGKKVGQQHYQGYLQSRAYLQDKLNEIDSILSEDAPEGDINDEAQSILEEYLDRKKNRQTGVLTGFSQLDDLTNGIMPGELWFIAGHTGEGKSMWCTNLIVQAALSGHHIVIGTAETSRLQYRRRIISRLSREPQFELPGGITYKKLKEGTLDPNEESCLGRVLEYLRTIGRISLFQIPEGASISYVEAKVKKYAAQQPVDLVVLDEARLIVPPRRRQALREELNDIILGLKRLATNANSGRGVGVVSPYQVSRSAYQEAVKSKKYTKACMAECAEAERSADLILSILRDPENKESRKLFAEVLKYRDGSDKCEFEIAFDFESCYMGDTGISSMDDVLNF